MKKKIIISLPIFLIVFFCTMSCEKIRYKDDFRAPILGKYKCKVEVLTKTIRCKDHELVFKKEINQEIHIVDNYNIEVGPAYYYGEKYAKQTKDILEYRGKYTWNGFDSFYVFSNHNSVLNNGVRNCYLRVSADSFYLIIDQNCEYGFNIEGKR